MSGNDTFQSGEEQSVGVGASAGAAAVSRLDRKKQTAISALLTHATIEKAALSVGISEKTLWRWLQMPDFAREYQAARTQVLEQTISVLHKATSGAVGALVRNLKCGTPSVEVRAAIGILDQTFRARELLETEERLCAVERALQSGEAAQAARRGRGW